MEIVYSYILLFTTFKKQKKYTMTKNSLFALCFLFLLGIKMNAQEAVTAAGGDATGTGGKVAYSVGQVVYTNVSTASGSVNQGVQQPYTLLVTGANNCPYINLLMTVYPNPSLTYINLNVGKQELKNLSFQLFDVQGKLLLDQQISNLETSIKMEDYTIGNYFLKVIDNQTEIKTFKIIKN